MNMWKILGIDQTTDINQIKRAYAAKAKECHPEEHPEEYQLLRQAYRNAVQYAKSQKEQETGRETIGSQMTHEVQPVEQPEHPGSWTKPETEESPEEAGENPQTANSERVTGQDGDLNFGEVETNRKRELKSRFFREFCDIARNPYLMNNMACWRFFLNQTAFRELYAEPDFPEALAREIRRFSKWDKETILFLEQRLQHLGGAVEEKSLWKKVRFRYYFDWIRFSGANEGIVEQEMLRLHGRFLEQVRNSGIWVSASLKDSEAVNCYLQFYFAYMAENREVLENSYRKNHRFRLMLRLAEVLVASLFLSVWVAGVILPGAGSQDQSGAESLNGQNGEGAAGIHEEYQQKIENMLEDTTERYQRWTEKHKES